MSGDWNVDIGEAQMEPPPKAEIGDAQMKGQGQSVLWDLVMQLLAGHGGTDEIDPEFARTVKPEPEDFNETEFNPFSETEYSPLVEPQGFNQTELRK